MNETKRFLRTLLPKRLDISGTVGFEDPAVTGLFIGFYESIAAMCNLRDRVRLAADFTGPGAKLRIALSGSVNIAQLVRPFAVLYMKKPVRQFLQFVMDGQTRG